MRVKGFGLGMVHAGVGVSWIDLLQRVPLTEVKLARRLVSGAAGDPKRIPVLESAFAAVRDAGLAAVGDGCDSHADFQMLLELGCSAVQGRFVAEPMPAADLVRWAPSWDTADSSGTSP